MIRLDSFHGVDTTSSKHLNESCANHDENYSTFCTEKQNRPSSNATDSETIASLDENAQTLNDGDLALVTSGKSQALDTFDPTTNGVIVGEESICSLPCNTEILDLASTDKTSMQLKSFNINEDLYTPKLQENRNEDDKIILDSYSNNEVPYISRKIKVLLRVCPSISGRDTVVNKGTIEFLEALNRVRYQSSSNSYMTEVAFDHVFSCSATQDQIFEAIKPSVQAFMQGYNSTVFAYGQTGTGKTYTLFGAGLESTLEILPSREKPTLNYASKSNHSKSSWGIVPRSLEYILRQLELSPSPESDIGLLELSFYQIYNDRVFDLLVDRKCQKPILIREQMTVDSTRTASARILLAGLATERITNLNEAFTLLNRGRANRIVRETEGNAASSRSHAIVQLQFEIQNSTSTNNGSGSSQVRRCSRLNLVDLAGSEKWNTDTEMEDQHSMELKTINSSLSALGNCIAALADPLRKHIPYRDSILTRVLQDSFGGNTQASLIATVVNSQKAIDETIRTLKFAERAKDVLQTVYINESLPIEKELTLAKQTIMKLREKMEMQQKKRAEQAAQELKVFKLQIRNLQFNLDKKCREFNAVARENKELKRVCLEDKKKTVLLTKQVSDLEKKLDDAKMEFTKQRLLDAQSCETNTKLLANFLSKKDECAKANNQEQRIHDPEPVKMSIKLSHIKSIPDSRCFASFQDNNENEAILSNHQTDSDQSDFKYSSQKIYNGDPSDNLFQSKLTKFNICHVSEKKPNNPTNVRSERSQASQREIGMQNNIYKSGTSQNPEEISLQPSNASFPILCDQNQFNPYKMPILPLHQQSGSTAIVIDNDKIKSPSPYYTSQGILQDRTTNQWLKKNEFYSSPILIQPLKADINASTSVGTLCTKHQLNECVLCKLKAPSIDSLVTIQSRPGAVIKATITDKEFISRSLGIREAYSESKVVLPSETGQLCGRHKLLNCFICCKTPPTFPHISASHLKFPPIPTVISTNTLNDDITSSTNNAVRTSLTTNLRNEDQYCKKHFLAECFLCSAKK